MLVLLVAIRVPSKVIAIHDERVKGTLMVDRRDDADPISLVVDAIRTSRAIEVNTMPHKPLTPVVDAPFLAVLGGEEF
jgi:hypothetical protein